MSGMAEVILRTSRLDLQDSLALARELSAAGFGPVVEAKAEALDEAAEKVMGPSDVLMDAATCRWIAMELRENAAEMRKP
jgi:hypothetical protein